MAASENPRAGLTGDAALLLSPALVTLLVHFYANAWPVYGIFRDELYFIACGEHLAWGYVDQPPMVAVVAAFTRWLLGDSLFAIRFLPAVAGAAVVFFAGLIAHELGGGRFARFLAQVAALICPVFLGIHTILSMNVFEHVLWALAAYIVVLIVKRDAPRLWLLFGGVAGIGLLNKHSFLFFGAALVAGLALTPARKYFLSKWLWAGGAIALLIVLPHILWQVQNNFPMWELLRRGQLYKNLPIPPVQFVLTQFLEMHPLNLLVSPVGLCWLLFSTDGKRFAFLGWTYLAALALFILLKGKPYYLGPAYSMLFAAGGVAVGEFVERRNWNWARVAIPALLVLGGILLSPFALPVLPEETYIRYSQFMGIQPGSAERHRMGRLPQHYADMHGWEEMAATVARVYNSLPPEERAKAAIFASNYGEAGAVDFFGPKYGLPKALSGHNNYFLWGPRNYTGEIVITVGEDREDVEKTFDQIELGATFTHPYVMPYENNLPIFICRKPKLSLQEVWPRVKKYI